MFGALADECALSASTIPNMFLAFEKQKTS
jgi:hypothetical protein